MTIRCLVILCLAALSLGGTRYYGRGPVRLAVQRAATPAYKVGIASVWNMDDNAANTTVDDSGPNNYNGTAAANTSTKSVPGVIGTALDFNGKSDAVLIGDYYRFCSGTNFSLNMWVYPQGAGVPWGKDTAGQRCYFLYMTTSTGYSYYHFNDAGTAEDLGDNTAAASLPLNVWTMVTVVYQQDATKHFQLWTNAIARTPKTPTLVSANKSANLYIGKMAYVGSENWWTGRIDQVVVWTNKLLSGMEITNLYNGGVGVTLP